MSIKRVYTKLVNLRVFFAIIAILLISYVYTQSPNIRFPVMLYKLSLVSIGSILGYYIDLLLFPSFRPRDISDELAVTTDKTHLEGTYRLACAANIRRAIVVAACILAVSVGL